MESFTKRETGGSLQFRKFILSGLVKIHKDSAKIKIPNSLDNDEFKISSTRERQHQTIKI